MEKITCELCGYESEFVEEFDECIDCGIMFCSCCGDEHDYLCEDCLDDILENLEEK